MKTYLQKIGRSIMLPVSILPVASLLVGIANWIGAKNSNIVSVFLYTAGMAILGALPVLFTVGIAVGMSKDKSGAAGLSGLVGFLVVTKLLAPEAVSNLTGVALENVDVSFNQISNVFVGIICGLIAAELYNRFSETKLPTALAFFSGKRLIPILTAAVSLISAGILFVVWPIAYDSLVSFGEAISGLGSLGAAIYGFGNKMLIPTGLHHALNSVFWFDVIGINDIGNFLSGEGVKGITGMYQAGFFPIMMFALPAAGLAIYRNAKPERKKVTGSLMIAAAFATFFTGVTEPIEFAFMFVAPSLYLVHALLTGVSMFIAATFHWTAGFAFSAGLVDYVLSLANPIANHPLMLIPLGIVMGFIYYFVFDFMIKKFNLKTPGREDEELIDEIDSTNNGESKYTMMAKKIYDGLGGNANILSIDNCITRLRLELNDTETINEKMIKSTGVPGVKKLDKHAYQIIVGTDVQFVADELSKILRSNPEKTALVNSSEVLYSPATGSLVELSEVNDEVFSTGMMGEGFAIKPNSNEVYAPVDGTVTSIFPTKHAITMLSNEGAEILIHIGIDTVELKGKPFEILVKEGDRISHQQLLARVDYQQFEVANKETDVLILITNTSSFKKIFVNRMRTVKAKDQIGGIQK